MQTIGSSPIILDRRDGTSPRGKSEPSCRCVVGDIEQIAPPLHQMIVRLQRFQRGVRKWWHLRIECLDRDSGTACGSRPVRHPRPADRPPRCAETIAMQAPLAARRQQTVGDQHDRLLVHKQAVFVARAEARSVLVEAAGSEPQRDALGSGAVRAVRRTRRDVRQRVSAPMGAMVCCRRCRGPVTEKRGAFIPQKP